MVVSAAALLLPLVGVPRGALAGPPAGVTFYVSPSGSDRGTGAASAPFRTLQRAQRAVRRIDAHPPADIMVILEAGTYRLTRPLTFGPADSGGNGHDVVWQAAPHAYVALSGARRITGWRRSGPARNLWVAAVPGWLRTRQLYVDGVRAVLASGSPPVHLSRTPWGYLASSPVMARWRDPEQLEMVYSAQLGQMSEPFCRVGFMQGRAIHMVQPCWNNSTRRGNNHVGYGTLELPTAIQNAYELMDHAGQFFLDGHTHRLYYIPRRGQDMRRADVEAPVLQTLIRVAGSSGRPVHNLVFSHLQLSFATWLQPGTTTGFSEIQANYTITGRQGYARQGLCHLARHGQGTCPFGAWTKEPGNVELSFDHDIRFLGDRFVHLGAAALDLGAGSQRDTVQACVFTDISGNGVEVGGVDRPEATGAPRTSNIRILDNHLFGFPVEYHGGVAILMGYASDSRIAHNQIDDIPYAGISAGWGGWPDKVRRPPVANDSHGNVIAGNLITDFLQTLADGGAIYTQGITGPSMAGGQRVTGNVIHGLLQWGEALHSDNGATYVTYDHNVLYDNIYDWSGNHYDYRDHPGDRNPTRYDPQRVIDNYWQQGYPNYPARHLKASGNTIISGPAQAPAAIVDAAGIRPPFRSILRWRPYGLAVPNAPQHVQVLYAFHHRAWVTWGPSYAQGSSAVTGYTVTACRAHDGLPRLRCVANGERHVHISAARLDRTGYAVVGGLRNGAGYTFTVTAVNADGASTPSIPSPVTVIGAAEPRVPGKPRWAAILSGRYELSLSWYPPARDRGVGAGHTPVLSYRIRDNRGHTYAIQGLSQLVLSNGGGKGLAVIPGLLPGRRYRFRICAITPVGSGPWVQSHSFRPLH